MSVTSEALVDQNAIKSIERYLWRLDDVATIQDSEYVIQIDVYHNLLLNSLHIAASANSSVTNDGPVSSSGYTIHGTGGSHSQSLASSAFPPPHFSVQSSLASSGAAPAVSWLLKFRKSGVIVNNKELVSVDVISIDAVISFPSLKAFWDLSKSSSSTSLTKGNIFTTGRENAIELFQRKATAAASSLTTPSSPQHEPIAPIMKFKRQTYTGEVIQPIKHGWLLKKRDIFTGWRPRYIVIYPGRVEYYVDEMDRYPRDVISLLGAEVSSPKKCNVNGVPDHWYIVVEPKGLGASKTLRLATEKSGYFEAIDWRQAFLAAATTAADSHGRSKARPSSASTAKKSSSDHHSKSSSSASQDKSGGHSPSLLSDTSKRLSKVLSGGNLVGNLVTASGRSYGSFGLVFTGSGIIVAAVEYLFWYLWQWQGVIASLTLWSIIVILLSYNIMKMKHESSSGRATSIHSSPNGEASDLGLVPPSSDFDGIFRDESDILE